MRPTIAVFVIISALLLGGCGTRSGQTRQLREQDADTPIDLQAGDRLELLLEGNPTTGYGWEQIGGAETIMKPADKPAFTAESRLVGAGGTYTFSFSAVAVGQTSIVMVYHRSFEPDVPPLKTFTVPVVVH
ncbi:MAG: protease inhibitor I42 family protein [Oscillochloris sp.]|nr:protease inhibitor I42 family protein [Oscillochloris sp.]